MSLKQYKNEKYIHMNKNTNSYYAMAEGEILEAIMNVQDTKAAHRFQ